MPVIFMIVVVFFFFTDLSLGILSFDAVENWSSDEFFGILKGF